MSSSWSNVPLDLLISIRDKLEYVDLLSFRSVCSQWHYASPIPNPGPTYCVESSNERNLTIKFYFKTSTIHKNFITPQFSFSSHSSYIGNSNGWLVLKDHINEILHLFDPVSNRKFILPRLNQKLLSFYEKLKPIAYHAYIDKVVVSPSIVEGIAAAGIVQVENRTNMAFLDRRLIFYRQRYGDRQRWSLLMEGSKRIIDICLAGDGRFYALGDDCELYMLDERPSLIKLKKIKLWLPKHILVSIFGNSIRSLRIKGHAMMKSGEMDLEIYGRCWSRKKTMGFITLKINVAKLNGYSNDIEAACESYDANYFYGGKYLNYSKHHFIPLFKEHHSKLSVKI